MRSALAIEHLGLRLRPINRALRAAADQQAAQEALLSRPDLTPYCITDEQVGLLLERVGSLAFEEPGTAPAGQPLTAEEHAAELRLRDQAAGLGVDLPLDELTDLVELTPIEQDMLLLCAAPELDRAYERIVGYVLDDLNRRFPCAELLCTVGAGSTIDRLRRRSLLAPAGRLRRHGLLRTHGDGATLLRQELRVTPGIIEFLLGGGGDIATLAADHGAVWPADARPTVPQAQCAALATLGRAMRAGTLDVVGLWGPRRAGIGDAVVVLADAADAGLRRVREDELTRDPATLRAKVTDALGVAAGLGAILWIDLAMLDEPAQRRALSDLLAQSSARVCLTGPDPWRSPDVLCRRSYAELELPDPAYRDRRAAWSHELPDLTTAQLDELAARYRMGTPEIRAVAAFARSDPTAGNGQGAADTRVRRAVTAVAHRSGGGLARAVLPRRTLSDLVLPADQHAEVREVLSAFRQWPRVAEDWGFGPGPRSAGVKALFTGESGTGKTLAAEAIAGALGLVLLVVDLSRVVSKWVGETEKHLEVVFQQADESQAVLFFDEADALFGKRGDITHGVDRYANMEVAHLLQRLERSDGLVILASNLRDNIDTAFTRRFHHIVHFPRPGRTERERIWRLALPADAHVGADVDLPTLAGLDLTGAGITATIRTAAILAAEAADPTITMTHVVEAIHRQYQQEARLLRPEDLGRHAALLSGASRG